MVTHSPCLLQACNNELVPVPWSMLQKAAWTQENQQYCKKSHTLKQNKTDQVSSCKACCLLTEIVLLHNCIRSQGQSNKYTNPSRITTSRDIADPLICRPRIMKNHDQWWAYTVIIHTSVACCSTVLEYKQTAETGRKEEATNARLTGVTMGSMTCRVKQPKPSPVKSEF